MAYALSLEAIGDDIAQMSRLYNWIGDEVEQRAGVANPFRSGPRMPWVARITGLCERYGLKREFQSFKKDYTRANSVGSRGVYQCYALDDGIYEVHEHISRRSSRRSFLWIDGGEAQEMARKDVEAFFAD